MATPSKYVTPLEGPSTSSAVPFTPHAYQEKAIAHLLQNPRAGLFLDPGLGKTAITMAAFKVLKQEGLSKGMLVVAPLRVAHSVWPAEVEKWDEFEGLSVAVLHGKGRALAETPHDIYVINYEGLDWLATQTKTLDKMLRKGLVDMLVFDELSKMKNHATKRFKTMKPYLHRFRRRVGLTGSPAPNGLMDLFGQMFCLDRGERLGQYVTHFRANYFVPAGPYDWRLREGGAEAIQDRIKDIVLYMSAEDYLDLPPVTEIRVEVELPTKARKAYQEVEDELFSMLDDGEVLTAPNAASALSKCKQIANGAVYLGDVDPITGETRGRDFRELHDEKIKALLDLVDEMQGQQLLIAYEFQHDLKRLLKALPKGTPHIGGGTSAKAAAEIERRWNGGEIPILLGHPQSIGHGLNLQKSGASAIAWFSPTWDFELYDQFNRRLRRQGTKAKGIRIHHFVAKRTVDLAVLRALRNKGRTQDRLMEALKEYRD